ncbi:MAG: YceI family protein [Candidatus Kapaibacteriales bacterium]
MAKWVIDPAHSEIEFKVKHMMISTVTGRFNSFEGHLEAENDQFDPADINVSIDVNSISTNNQDRDNHLKSEEFFSAEKHPHMHFKSKELKGDKLIGDLTIKDVTKQVELDVEQNGVAVDPYGQTKAGFEAVGNISRKEFGLTWNAVTEAGNIVVGDNVKMIINSQFIKKD